MISLQELIDNFLYSVQEYNKDNPATLTKIIDQLEEISKHSHNLDYLPINNLALLLQDNLLCIYEEHQTLSDSESKLLEQWPKLFDNYLNKREINLTTDKILDNLSKNTWPIPIEENDKDILKELLLSTIDTDYLKPDIDQEELLSTTFTTLVTTVSRIVGEDSKTLIDFENQIQELSQSAELSGFIGFHDLCLMALDNISLLSQNVSDVNDTQMTLISAWFGLAKKYLDNPSSNKYAIALVNNLSNAHWPSPIPQDDKTILLEILGIPETNIIKPEKKGKSSFTQILTKTKNLILRYNDSEQRLVEINDSIQSLIDIANSDNLLGLQDICLLYQESLQDFFDDKKFVDFEELNFIAEYPDLVRDYYYEPRNTGNVDKLIDYLQNTIWLTPLTQQDSDLLNNILTNTNDDADVRTFHGNVLAAAIEQSNITNNIPLSTNHEIELDIAVSDELVDMLLSEMQAIANESKSLFPEPEQTTELQHEALGKFQTRIERFSNACQAAELTGLYQASNIILDNIKTILSSSEYVDKVISTLLKQWVLSVTEYLSNLGQKKYSSAIAEVLTSQDWKECITDDLSTILIESLQRPHVSSDINSDEGETVAQVGSDDVSIEITDDINSDLLEGLLQELPEQTSELSKSIQSFCSSSPEPGAIDRAQRIAHTIKGSANTVGIRGIAFLTHQLEDILSILNQHRTPPNAELAETLTSATDCLEEMTEALMQKQSAPDYALSVLQNVLDWSNLLKSKGINILDSGDEIVSPSSFTPAIPEKSEESEKTNIDDAESQPVQTIPIPTKTIDTLIRLLGESMILNLQLNEKIEYSALQTNQLQEHNSTIRELSLDLDRHIEISGNTLSQQKAVNQSEVFDPLELEEYNELHTTSNRIVESASDAHEINSDIEAELKKLNELLFSQSNLQQEIYDVIMQSRMVPVKSIIPRLERCVRQTCRITKKQTDFICIGEETLIDRNILHKMIDPLMHMIRNSIDHGIESAEERKNKSKPDTGTIRLTINRVGTQIVFLFEDDGIGLDKDKIASIAKSKGIIDEHNQLTDDDLYQLILQPGFTTREKTTQTSGRGIGMDVVYSQILSLNGRLLINSNFQNGIHFELTVPVSLMTSHAVFIKYEKQLLAISNYNIIRILHPSDGEIITQNGVQKILIDGETLDIDTIEYLLSSSNNNNIDPENRRSGLLISYENIKRVVLIDMILDSRNIVIKDMGSYLKNVQGVVGATIVGDGSVVPVLDLTELIRTSMMSKTSSTITMAHTSIIQLLPSVMIVDDSISTRRALSQVMKDAGYEIETAKDGIEAIGKMEKKLPSIILVDFEMPRMNGLELTSHVRGMDTLKDIPIIMITSRTTDKHKHQAFEAGVNIYTIKPFSEDTLLDDVASLLDDNI